MDHLARSWFLYSAFKLVRSRWLGISARLLSFLFLISGPVFESKMRLGLLAHVCTVMYLFHVNKGKAVVSYVEIQKSERSFFLFLNTLSSRSKP